MNDNVVSLPNAAQPPKTVPVIGDAAAVKSILRGKIEAFESCAEDTENRDYLVRCRLQVLRADCLSAMVLEQLLGYLDNGTENEMKTAQSIMEKALRFGNERKAWEYDQYDRGHAVKMRVSSEFGEIRHWVRNPEPSITAETGSASELKEPYFKDRFTTVERGMLIKCARNALVSMEEQPFSARYRKPITRRDFFKRAGEGAALGTVIGTGLLAVSSQVTIPEEDPSKSRKVSASTVVGAGFGGIMGALSHGAGAALEQYYQDQETYGLLQDSLGAAVSEVLGPRSANR